MSDNGGETGAFLAGFILGGLVGAAAALILAPQSGEQTRTQIREKGIELRDRAEDVAEDARKRAEVAAAEARKRADELAARADMAATEARKRADELAARSREVYDQQRVKLGSAVEEGKKAALRKRDELIGGGRIESSAPSEASPAAPPEPVA